MAEDRVIQIAVSPFFQEFPEKSICFTRAARLSPSSTARPGLRYHWGS